MEASVWILIFTACNFGQHTIPGQTVCHKYVSYSHFITQRMFDRCRMRLTGLASVLNCLHFKVEFGFSDIIGADNFNAYGHGTSFRDIVRIPLKANYDICREKYKSASANCIILGALSMPWASAASTAASSTIRTWPNRKGILNLDFFLQCSCFWSALVYKPAVAHAHSSASRVECGTGLIWSRGMITLISTRFSPSVSFFSTQRDGVVRACVVCTIAGTILHFPCPSALSVHIWPRCSTFQHMRTT